MGKRKEVKCSPFQSSGSLSSFKVGETPYVCGDGRGAPEPFLFFLKFAGPRSLVNPLPQQLILLGPIKIFLEGCKDINELSLFWAVKQQTLMHFFFEPPLEKIGRGYFAS